MASEGGRYVGLVLAPNTDEVLNEMQALDADVKVMHKVLFGVEGGGTEFDKWFSGQWAGFLGKWNRFFENNKGFWSRFISTSGIYNQTQEFRKELIGLRGEAEELGVDFKIPDFSEPKEEVSLTGRIASLAKFVVVSVVIIGGVVIAILLLR